jgi:D-serine deaminase-like pyridoxal phosphate-dependent protein
MKKPKRMGGLVLVFAITVGVALSVLVFIRPKARPVWEHNELKTVDDAFQKQGRATPALVVLTSALNANIDRVQSTLSPRKIGVRLVTKSLPSAGILKHISQRLKTNRFMEFHPPFLPELYEAFSEGPLDVLFGKPVAAQAIDQILKEAHPALRHRILRETTWLIDTQQRAREYIELAKRWQKDLAGHRLKISLEINVGLHRGGFDTAEELDDLLATIRSEAQHVQVCGFMGYDGHVGFAPAFLALGRGRKAAILDAHQRTESKYKYFIDWWRRQNSPLFCAEPVFNGGGSRTYALFDGEGANDVALGSAFLMPSDYDGPTLVDHQPALFIAAPVLKIISPPGAPFLGVSFAKLWTQLDPNMAKGYFIYGGWGVESFSPSGLRPSPFYEHTPNRNLLPNQDLLMGSSSHTKKVGSFIFFRPPQNDSLFTFNEIVQWGDGKLYQTWKPFNRRF